MGKAAQVSGVNTNALSAQLQKAVTLTDAATIAIDASLGSVFKVTLAGNRTLGAPTNSTDGQTITILVRQDGTGSRTLAYNAVYQFNTTNAQPTLTITAGAKDYLTFMYDATSTKWVCQRIVKA